MKEAIKYLILIIVVSIINYIIFININKSNNSNNNNFISIIDSLNQEKQIIDSIKHDRDSIEVVIKYIENDKYYKIQEMLSASDSVVVNEFIKLVTK